MSNYVEYQSGNGYKGILYGRSSFSIRDKGGKEVFHTGFRNINTYEELKEHIDGFPVFIANLHKHWEELENCDEDADI